MKILGSILISIALIAVAGSAWGQGLGVTIIHCAQECRGYPEFAQNVATQLGNKPELRGFAVQTATGDTGDLKARLPSGRIIDLQDVSGSVNPQSYAEIGAVVDKIVSEVKEETKDYGKKISVTTDWVWNQDPLSPKTSPASYNNVNPDNDAVAATRPGESSSQAETKKITEDKQKELSINATAHQQRYVTLGRVKVGPGEYTVGPDCQLNTYPQGNTTKGVRLTEWDEGAFKECSMPTAGADPSQSGFGNVGNGTNLFGSPGSPGAPGLGANSLLPALLSGLLGQGFGGGGFGNQNPAANQGYPAVNNNALACDRVEISPVCGEDGKTYNNSCYLSQSRVTLKSQGVCPSSSPSPTPNTSAILTQLSASGVPSALLDGVRNVVASVLSGILSGSLAVPETVVAQ